MKSYSEARTSQILEMEAQVVYVPDAIIVGAGPSGLAIAACLKEQGVISSVVLERSSYVASLSQHKTYDRLRLHLPKRFCQLSLTPLPTDLPTYPTMQQFAAYLEAYAQRFDIRLRFNHAVVSAEFNGGVELWRVRAIVGADKRAAVEYISRWLVIATGKNAEEVVPDIDDMVTFRGVHDSITSGVHKPRFPCSTLPSRLWNKLHTGSRPMSRLFEMFTTRERERAYSACEWIPIKLKITVEEMNGGRIFEGMHGSKSGFQEESFSLAL
ncbi:indole-3-pyruvate monooxygenase YUCCA2-like [Canna indica]|uniref:indole-3-pyruvate monooxygenase n=1 Tax=Canna indica TaxID=4628 RepID=A0AAQ3Q3W0_9LILI|nr:indole-3-pyruvate monooxygenase YUCCA2-like [Canna indica]